MKVIGFSIEAKYACLTCLNLSNLILATLTPFHFQRIPNPFRVCLHPDVSESHIIEINWIKKNNVFT